MVITTGDDVLCTSPLCGESQITARRDNWLQPGLTRTGLLVREI